MAACILSAGRFCDQGSERALSERWYARTALDDLLKLKRDYWGIENGLHQRLDGAGREDFSRVRLRNNAWVLSLFRRWAISVAGAWIARQANPRRATTQGFFDAMRRNHAQGAFNLIRRRSPTFYDDS